MTIDVIHTGPLGVNTFIVPLGGSAVFIVDPCACSFSDDEFAITRFLEEKKLTPVAVVLTHGHFDHVAGLPHLVRCFPNIAIAIHKNDAPFIGAQSERLQSESLCTMGFDEFIPSVTNLPEPTCFLEEGKTLYSCITGHSLSQKSSSQQSLDKELLSQLPLVQQELVNQSLAQWRVLHTPGHPSGSVCLYNETERTLISGDTLFYHSYGRTDLPGGDEVVIQKSLRRLQKEIPDNTLVYPGHDAYGFLMAQN